MPGDVVKEIAATSEQPTGDNPPRHLVSQEFLVLFQQINHLDDKVIQRIGQVEGRINQVENRISQVEEKLTNRINQVENRISQVEEKLTNRINQVEEKLGTRMDKMDDKLNNIRLWAIGTVVAILVGFAGVIATLINH